MANETLVALIVGLLGSGGLGGVAIAIINNIKLHKQGAAGNEDQRREDLVKQRDEALLQAKIAEDEQRAEEVRADAERARRIQWEEEAARLRIKLILAGQDPGKSPPPDAPNPKE